MGVRGLNVMLGLALLASLGFNWSMRGPRTYRSLEFVPNMMRTVRYNAFEPNANFADGATLRVPPPGTIPRGLPPIPPSDAKAPIPNPFSGADPSAREHGAVVYRTFCQTCHGPRGLGDGVVVKYGFPKPPTLLRDRTKEMSDEQLFRVLTTGRGKMASYASQLSRDDRWRVILYVRALQQGSGE